MKNEGAMGHGIRALSLRDNLVNHVASGVVRYYGGNIEPQDLDDGPVALAIADYLDSNPRWLAISETYNWPRLKASVRRQVKKIRPITKVTR